jgi:hypothetical protein
MIFVASFTGCILLVVFSLKPIAKGYSELLYKTLFHKKRDNKIIDVELKNDIAKEAIKSQNYTWKQIFALLLWILMIFINLFSESWFNTAIGNNKT